MLVQALAAKNSGKPKDASTLDTTIFRLWFSCGSIGPMLTTSHASDAENELSKRLSDPDSKLVVKNRPLTSQALKNVRGADTVSKSDSPPAQAPSTNKNGKKGKQTGTGAQHADLDPKSKAAAANKTPLHSLPTGPGGQIAVEVQDGADAIVLRYIPFSIDIRTDIRAAVTRIVELDIQKRKSAYFKNKDEVRVGPVFGFDYRVYRPIPGDDIVDWIYHQFYVEGEDPWTFRLREREGRKGTHILDFIDEYIGTTLKKAVEQFELKENMK